MTSINATSIYPLEAFKQHLGLGSWALREARRNGLRVRYVAGKGWVTGRDWIDYVERVGKSSLR